MEEIRQRCGSRNFDGNVPNVNWNDFNGKMNVNWTNPSNANGNLRVREVVSHERSPPHGGDLYFSDLIQPFVILDVSCKSISMLI